MKIRANVTKVNNEDTRVKGYADITVEDCCRFRGIRIVEGYDGGLFVRYPQKLHYENGVQKLTEDGKPVYSDVYYGTSKEANEAIKGLVLEAYHSEKGYAYLNPGEGEHSNGRIEAHMHACNGVKAKAAGRLIVGGYIRVPDVFVHLRTDKDGKQFLGISYPSYKSGDNYREFVEPLEKGKLWDEKTQTEKEYNFKRAVEGSMKKQTREFHPELANLSESQAEAPAEPQSESD